jgi:DNA-directed RNA polymerase alpha subunit
MGEVRTAEAAHPFMTEASHTFNRAMYYAKFEDPRLAGLSTRIRNCFANEYITFETLPTVTRGELQRVPNFGRKSIEELAEWMDAQGIEHRLHKPAPQKKRCPHCGGELR